MIKCDIPRQWSIIQQLIFKKLSSHEKTWENPKQVLLCKRSQLLKTTPYNSGKGQTMEPGKRLMIAKSWQKWRNRAEDFWAEKLPCYYNDGKISSYICPKPHNVQHQEWTRKQTVYSEWHGVSDARFWSRGYWWWGGQWLYMGWGRLGEFLYCPLNFAVNLKMLKKIAYQFLNSTTNYCFKYINKFRLVNGQ